MNMQMLILVLVFFAVTGLALGAAFWFNRGEAVKQRLDQLVSHEGSGEKSLTAGSEWQAKVVRIVGPMARISSSKAGWEESRLRVRFIQAGLRQASWPADRKSVV